MPTLRNELKNNVYNIKRTIEDLVEQGNTDLLTSGAAAVPYPCDGSTYIYRTNGSLYDETTGLVDCSNFSEGTELTLKWTMVANPANANADLKIQVIIPDGGGVGVDVTAYEKDYIFEDTSSIAISNTTAFYISDIVIANGFKVQVSCTGFNVTLEDRAIMVIH